MKAISGLLDGCRIPFAIKLLVLLVSICTHVSAQDLLSGYMADVVPLTTSGKLPNVKVDQQSIFHFSSKETNKSAAISNMISYKINKEAFSKAYQQHPEQLSLDLPISAQSSIVIDLEQVNLLTPDFVVSTSDGTIYLLEDEQPYFYKGTVKGQENSSAVLTMHNDELRILITDSQGTYQVASKDHSNTYQFFNAKNLSRKGDYGCHADNLQDQWRFEQGSEPTKDNLKSEESCISIYLETDYLTYQHFNASVEECSNYILALFNEVAALYSREQIYITLSEIHVVTTEADDYMAAASNIREALDIYGGHKKDNYNGRLAFYLTKRQLLGGIAWINTLCKTYQSYLSDWDGDGVQEEHHFGPYAVCSAIGEDFAEYPIYSWDVNVLAHELGHNIGSPHTHACTWGPNNNKAIDNCYLTEGNCGLLESPIPVEEHGTIMSYCHLKEVGIDLNKGFGTLPAQLLKSKVAASSCLTACQVENEYGCTDETSHQYNPNALIDDGSCSETCDDNIKNADETGIDCGGSFCMDCKTKCTQNYLKLQFTFDSFPEDISWTLIDAVSAEMIDSGSNYGAAFRRETLIHEYCLPAGTYLFQISDSFGDGLTGNNGEGFYIYDSTDLLRSGNNFGSAHELQIVFEESDCADMLALHNMALDGSYTASSMLQASESNADANAMVRLRSTNVEMNNGFSIDLGGQLEVFNDGCN